MALVLLLIGALMQIDDDLHPDAQVWLDQFQTRQQIQSPGYDYLSQMNEVENGKKISPPEGDLFCRQRDREDCYLFLYSQKGKWQKVLIVP